MRSKVMILGISFCLSLFLHEGVLACSCAVSPSPCTEFGAASAVFIGTVVGVRDNPRMERDQARKAEDAGEMREPRAVKFTVVQAFIGVETAEVEIATGLGGGDCGYGFTSGATYLVYAFRYRASKSLATSICTRTRPVADAAEDLQFLSDLPSRSAGVTISGVVVRHHFDAKEQRTVTAGELSGARLVIEGEGESKEVRTDAQGRYRLAGLDPGTYKIRLVLPEELTVSQPEREFKVSDRGCAVVNYSVADNGRISGTLTDVEGQPAAGIHVTLIDAADPELKNDFGRIERTDEEGRYAFRAVPPGRYLLAVNLLRYPQYGDPTHAFPRTFFPGVSTASDAKAIELGAGENLRGRDMVLPQRRAARAVEVTVVWADGQPVANANVSFTDVTENQSGVSQGAQTDAQGRFTLKGYEGQVYIVNARSSRPFVGDYQRDGPMERADPLRIALVDPAEPARIVITRLR